MSLFLHFCLFSSCIEPANLRLIIWYGQRRCMLDDMLYFLGFVMCFKPVLQRQHHSMLANLLQFLLVVLVSLYIYMKFTINVLQAIEYLSTLMLHFHLSLLHMRMKIIMPFAYNLLAFSPQNVVPSQISKDKICISIYFFTFLLRKTIFDALAKETNSPFR